MRLKSFRGSWVDYQVHYLLQSQAKGQVNRGALSHHWPAGGGCGSGCGEGLWTAYTLHRAHVTLHRTRDKLYMYVDTFKIPPLQHIVHVHEVPQKLPLQRSPTGAWQSY